MSHLFELKFLHAVKPVETKPSLDLQIQIYIHFCINTKSFLYKLDIQNNKHKLY